MADSYIHGTGIDPDFYFDLPEPLNKPWTRYCGCRDMKENLGYCVNCGYKIQPEPKGPSVVPCLQCSRHEADAERLAKENRELKEKLARRIHGS